MALPHALYAAAAAGKDGALLAQPLRNGLQQGRRTRGWPGSDAGCWRRNRRSIPAGLRGQLELFRDYALPNFRDLLVEVAKDQAMLVWLDGRQNTKARPQENFAREIMELFTIGVGQFVEADVYAGARVFTGWNLQRIGNADDPNNFYQFFYNAAQHDTNEKTFSFPIYAQWRPHAFQRARRRLACRMAWI